MNGRKDYIVLSFFDKLRSSASSSAPTGAVEFIIAGLGNPGSKYENTRHNIGYSALDALAEKQGASVKKLKFKSLCGDASVAGKRCLLMKPTTFMNNSGQAIAEASGFYKIPPQRIIIISDDISLDVAKIRIRRKGSAGGHNGLKSIIMCLGSDEFPRIKIGVGKKPHPDYDLKDWVLSDFPRADLQLEREACQRVCDALEYIVLGKFDEAMSKFN